MDKWPGSITSSMIQHLAECVEKGYEYVAEVIARKGALLSGGDIELVKGELGGAGFRVLLAVATNGFQAFADRG
jgi:hypothetical protein